jgi:hypothetical protein
MPVLMPSDIVAAAGGFDSRHVLMTSATHMKFFCDWLNFSDGVFSLGDVLIDFSQAVRTTCLVIWAALIIKDSNSGD